MWPVRGYQVRTGHDALWKATYFTTLRTGNPLHLDRRFAPIAGNSFQLTKQVQYGTFSRRAVLMAVTVRRYNRQERFTTISNDFLRTAMPLSAFRVACYLMTHTERFEMTHARIAKAIDLSERTVGDALRELDRLGYVIRIDVRNARGHRTGTELLLSDVPFTDEERAALTAESAGGPETPPAKSPPAESPPADFSGHKKTSLPKGDHYTREDHQEKILPDESGDASQAALPLDVEPPGQPDAAETDDQDYAAEFAAFWDAYPRKVSRGRAEQKYAVTRRSGIPAELILNGARRYAVERAGEEAAFTKHPTTWLNQRCWEDEPLPHKTGSGLLSADNVHSVRYNNNDSWADEQAEDEPTEMYF